MNTAKIFTNGGSQAVRLPKEFQFDADEVYINKVGATVVLFPKATGWDLLIQSLDEFTDDYMADRKQPMAAEDRETF